MLKKIRQRLVKAPFTEQQNITGKHFIVTGCAEGSLGFATAKILLEWGGTVTVTKRSNSRSIITALKEQLPLNTHSSIYSHDLDISNSQSIQQFVAWYKTEVKTLDVLINNAGIHLDLLSKWKEPKLSDDGVEIQWRTNYLGTTELTHQLLPLLQQQAKDVGDARVVNVVSMLHDKGSNSEFFTPSKPYNSWEAYGLSKLGLVHFTKEIERRFGNTGLHAYCLHPGSVYTNVAGKGLAGNPVIETLRNLMAPIERFSLKTPEEGAQTQVMCATAPELKGGEYYRNCRTAPSSDDSHDEDIAKQLWDAHIKRMEGLVVHN